jgi:hypothetical protein
MIGQLVTGQPSPDLVFGQARLSPSSNSLITLITLSEIAVICIGILLHSLTGWFPAWVLLPRFRPSGIAKSRAVLQIVCKLGDHAGSPLRIYTLSGIPLNPAAMPLDLAIQREPGSPKCARQGHYGTLSSFSAPTSR